MYGIASDDQYLCTVNFPNDAHVQHSKMKNMGPKDLAANLVPAIGHPP